MKAEEEARYFKIGVFVISGLVLLVILLLLLGASHIFTQTMYGETYFNESVQGLSVGSPVKYRGINIGRVTRITFVDNVYHVPEQSSYSRYIYVAFTINSAFLSGLPKSRLRQEITKDIKMGLRTKLALQDLTGNAYLEINFTSPRQNPVLSIDWSPKYFYIPSTTSILTRFTDSVQGILAGLQKVNFQKFFKNVQTLANTTNQAMLRVDGLIARTQSSIISSAHNLDSVSYNMQQLTNTLKENPSGILFNKPQRVDPAKL